MTLDELQPLAQRLIDLVIEHSIPTKGRHIALPPALCSKETAAQLQERVGLPVLLDAEMPPDQILLTGDELTQEEMDSYWAKPLY